MEGGISNKMGKDILFVLQQDLFLRASCSKITSGINFSKKQ